jgi:hypothetical protein
VYRKRAYCRLVAELWRPAITFTIIIIIAVTRGIFSSTDGYISDTVLEAP